MSINEDKIVSAKRSLINALSRSPENGLELYQISRDIISSAIGARIDYTHASFNSIVGIESELSSDNGAGLEVQDVLFQKYAISLQRAQSAILELLKKNGIENRE
ncbi:hypothetical protein [Pelagerythrobacter marinus]|uniref:hypothetical protein n=1 Tax=Pelagerythrobacter marinus TaxID=538382 RepID=UPI0020371EC4|nr:hypothetical protein [Pelagerythrobacter marinus]USA40636.1 hypothetical protein NCF86_05645 [Pelagerythrobacter marinus]WPZ08193.1 hypothetical protein T8T98_06715 [Pelagerythrobacter marinus]